METKRNSQDPVMIQLLNTLRMELKEQLKDVLLFGSRARGDFQPESDYDVIVLVDRETRELSDKIGNLASDVGWKHNVPICVFVYEESKFESAKYEPLFMNVRKEGISVCEEVILSKPLQNIL